MCVFCKSKCTHSDKIRPKLHIQVYRNGKPEYSKSEICYIYQIVLMAKYYMPPNPHTRFGNISRLVEKSFTAQTVTTIDQHQAVFILEECPPILPPLNSNGRP